MLSDPASAALSRSARFVDAESALNKTLSEQVLLVLVLLVLLVLVLLLLLLVVVVLLLNKTLSEHAAGPRLRRRP